MRTSTGKPTKAQQERFSRLIGMGCVCCKKLGFYSRPEIHHIVEGMRRVGHDATLPLCPWHHRKAYVQFSCAGGLGPSIADGSKAFARRWGSQRELLEQVNKLIGC